MKTKQFSIHLVNLDPVSGSEQRGVRPCLVLQTNAVADFWKTTIIAPFTTKKLGTVYRTEVFVHASSENGLFEDSKLNIEQVRVVDKQRIVEMLGILEDQYTDDVLGAMDIVFDRHGDFRSGV